MENGGRGEWAGLLCHNGGVYAYPALDFLPSPNLKQTGTI